MNLKYRNYKTLDQKHASSKRETEFFFLKNEENLLKKSLLPHMVL